MSKVDFTPLNVEQVAILNHTFNNEHGLFCGDSKNMQALVEQGLMESAGRKSFVPDEYFRLTDTGKEVVKTALTLK